MDLLNIFTNYFPSFFPELSKYFIFIGVFGIFVFFLLIVFWVYSLHLCIKTEKDRTKRNIWLSIIIIGKLTGAFLYIFLEKILNNKTPEEKQ